MNLYGSQATKLLGERDIPPHPWKIVHDYSPPEAFKCGPRLSSISFIRELTINAEFQAPPQV